MRRGNKQTHHQKMQALQADSKQAEENLAFTKPTYHKDKHEPNRPSIG